MIAVKSSGFIVSDYSDQLGWAFWCRYAMAWSEIRL